MRLLSFACAIGVALATISTAEAMSGGRAPRDPSQVSAQKIPDDIAKRGAEYLEKCLADWDTATHMTKQEWVRTCRRVAQDRLNFLIEQAKEDRSISGNK